MRIEILREFVALSRGLSFTAAAREMNVTQPAFSSHIQLLEKEVGVQLVERRPGANSEIRFTPAGQMFLEDASQLLDSYDRMLQRCRGGLLAEERVIVQLSYLPGRKQILNSCLNELKEELGTEVVIKSPSTKNLLDQIEKCDCDCGIYSRLLGEPPAHYFSCFDFVPLDEVEMLLWIKSTSHLCRLDGVGLADLKDMPVPIPSGGKITAWEESQNSIFESVGVHPRYYIRYAESVEDYHSKVQDNDVVFVGSDCTDDPQLSKDDRVFVPLDPPVYLTTWMAFRKNGNESLERLKSIVRAQYEQMIR